MATPRIEHGPIGLALQALQSLAVPTVSIVFVSSPAPTQDPISLSLFLPPNPISLHDVLLFLRSYRTTKRGLAAAAAAAVVRPQRDSVARRVSARK